MRHLVDQELAFGTDVLATAEAKVFFRRWRKRDWKQRKAWTKVRKDKYVIGDKEILGSALISGIRRHLLEIQRNLCCYCQRELQGIAYARPVEHILSKKDYPQYAFHYRNLAVSCFDCNLKKSHHNWTKWPKGRRRYVSARRCKEFFHPRYHSYDEHIHFIRMRTNGASISAYVGVTRQGRNLCTNLLADSARREVALTANPRLEAALFSLRADVQMLENSALNQDLERFLEKLEGMVLATGAGIP
jgi:uncharacterized protein (TIGR02646 family)